ncbi:MAG: response regulator, partial [Rhodoferax sp.]|uniref:response regulator n=1 Tax=Rhodoferax sp. TaxID=50421 RepID=UPI003266CB4F
MGGEMTVVSTPGSGSVFRVKLFLPEIHGADLKTVRSSAPRLRRAYLGPRRKLLVVDNEEADRELLAQLLQPLGFEVRTAASGHDALDLLAAGYQPDAVLMDLAMPGIDGWETIRRIKADGLTQAHIAIVSANAFDKGLDNDVGIRIDDFITKPVRHSELLDWLERRLQLQWVDAPAVAAPPPPAPVLRVWPDAARLQALRQVAELGFYRGILNQLAALEQAQPECRGLAQEVRTLAQQFQFEAIGRLLAQAPESPSSPPSPASSHAP